MPHVIKTQWPAVVYGLLLVLAAAVRFGGLTEMPHTLWVDEAWFSLKGGEVFAGEDLLPLEPPGLGIGDSAAQIYGSALARAVGFPAPYTSRLASAAYGWLTVAATYPLMLSLYRGMVADGGRQAAALAATAVMATHFAAVLYSRHGLQMAGAGLATVVSLYALHQTYERNSRRWALATGVVMGAGQTTYEAALALPLVLAAYAAVRWRWPGALSRRRVIGLAALAALAGVVTFTPMLWFYSRNPGIFLAHVGQTQTLEGAVGWGDRLGRVVDGLMKVAAGISIRGDLLPGRNLAGRPFFDAFTSLLVWGGLAWAAVRAGRQPAAQLMFVWTGVLWLPSALSDQPPAFTRMLPLAPALAGFAGLGVQGALAWGAARGAGARAVALAALALGLTAGGAASMKALFYDWPRQPRLFDALYFGARLTAEQALAHAGAANVFLTTASEQFVRYPFALLLGDTPVRAFDATPACLPYADRAGRDSVYGVIQVIDPASGPALARAYPLAEQIGAVMHPDGYAYALFWRVPAGTPAPTPNLAVDVAFEGGLRLAGVTAPPAAARGETIDLTLFWQAAAGPLPAGLNSFVHIGRGAASDPLIAHRDGPLCPGFRPDWWEPGYAYIETHMLSLAPDALPGRYDIRVGVYQPGEEARLAVTSSALPVENDRVVLASFEVR
jgi:hypothetical protein